MKNIKNSKKANETEPNSEPLPPEPRFYDQPKGLKKAVAIFYDLVENRKVQAVFIILVLIIVGWVFFAGPSNPKNSQNEQIQTEDRRVLATSQAMDRAINQSVKSAAAPKSNENTAPQKTRSRKRNFETAIAVFVEKPASPEKTSFKTERPQAVKLGIPSGTKIPALLADRIFSFNVAAPVTAFVPKDFKSKEETVLPKDSKFLGEVNIVKSVDRVNIRFDLLVLPDGREIRIQAVALSEDGSGGVKGRVDKHTDTKILKAVGETLLAGASLFAGSRLTDPYSLEDQMRTNLAGHLTDQAAQDLRNVKTDKSITVESDTRIQIMLLEAI